jgi:recombination protein RecA
MFGNPETTTGGRALKFYSSIRLDIRRIQAIKDGDKIVGSRTRAKVVKNKVAAPFREAEFDILYGEGISREGDLLDLGVASGLLEKSGTWISYEGERLGQGRDNARNFLKENRDIRDKIETALRLHLGLTTGGKAPAATASAAASGDEAKPTARAAAGNSGNGGSQSSSTANAAAAAKARTGR